MHVMTPAFADLPDALVWLVPMLARILGELANDRSRVRVGTLFVTPCLDDRVDDLAVDVELHLIGSGVAKPNGPRLEMPAKIPTRAFARRRFAEYIIEHTQRRTREPRCMREPIDERARLFDVPEPEQ